MRLIGLAVVLAFINLKNAKAVRLTIQEFILACGDQIVRLW
jgi:hypothetical protein